MVNFARFYSSLNVALLTVDVVGFLVHTVNLCILLFLTIRLRQKGYFYHAAIGAIGLLFDVILLPNHLHNFTAGGLRWWYALYIAKAIPVLANAFSITLIYLTAVLSIDRYLALTKPTQYRKYSTIAVKTAVLAVVLAVSTSICTVFVTIVDIVPDNTTNGTQKLYDLVSSKISCSNAYQYVDYVVLPSVQSILPCSVMLLFTYKNLVKLRAITRQYSTVLRSCNRTWVRNEAQMTKLMIVAVSICCMTYLPFVVCCAIYLVKYVKSPETADEPGPISSVDMAYYASLFVINVAHQVNLFAFAAISRRYRRSIVDFQQWLFCRRGRH